MRGETKSLVAMSLWPRPSLTSRTTSRSVGVRGYRKALAEDDPWTIVSGLDGAINSPRHHRYRQYRQP